MKEINIAIVASKFNEKVTDALIAGAKQRLQESSLQATLIQVPGAFEIPIATQRAIAQGSKAIITVGCVIRGETDHFDFVCRGCTDGLMRLMLDTSIPIGFGVLMTNTLTQAQVRSSTERMIVSADHHGESAESNKGYEATDAVIQLLHQFNELS